VGNEKRPHTVAAEAREGVQNISSVKHRAGEGIVNRRIQKELNAMLCLSMAPGDYITVGENVVLQFDRMSGERCKLLIDAPREVPIVRGQVLERQGGERPPSVLDKSRFHTPEVPWNRSKAQALEAMRKLLDQMDSRDQNVRDLRRQLNHIFPIK